MKKNSLILWSIMLIMIIASLSTLYFTGPRIHQSSSNQITAFFKQLHYQEFDNTGNVHLAFKTPFLRHFKRFNSSMIQQPDIHLISSPQSSWYIQAQRAQSWYGREVIVLHKNVQFYNPGSSQDPETTIKTSRAYLYPQRHYATSEQQVLLKRPGTTLHGTKLRANLKTGVINLLQHTHGFYQSHNTSGVTHKRKSSHTHPRQDKPNRHKPINNH